MIATQPANQPAAAARRPSKIKTFAFGLLLLGALVALLMSGIIPRVQRKAELASEVNAVETGEPIVNTTILRTAALTSEITLPASMQAILEVPIYARTEGYLKRRQVDIGDRVKAGQLLAEIDSPELDQQLAQARATLAHARAAVTQAEANLKQSQSRLVLAETTANRWKTLVGRGVLSKQEGDEKQSAYEAMQAEVDAGKSNIQAAQSDVIAQQANVSRLEELHAFEQVKAPFDGVITARNVDPGALISAGASSEQHDLFRIAKTDELRIFVNVPQSYSVAIHPGEQAFIRVGEFRGREFPGKIVRTADSLDPNSRTLLTEIHIPNGNHVLRPGMFSSVRFQLDRPNAPIVAPAAAFVFRADGPHVVVVREDSRIRFAKVIPGRDYGSTMEILGGVNPGDRIVLNPSDDLADGTKVRVGTANP